jgi:outer membrane lipoprotein carrier protein
MKLLRSASVAVTFVLIACAVASAAGDNAALTKAIDGLQRHYRETRTFSAKFSEEIAPVGAPKRERLGTVYLMKPGRMRWEYDEPSKELLVSDGKLIYNYDPELNQVVEAPLAQALRTPGATEFLLGVGDIKKDFNGALIDTPDSTLIHLKLVSKGQGNTVEVGLDPKNYNVETIRVIDQLGNVTAMKFTNIVNNPPISESIFSFSPPAGVDIVKPEPLK